MALESAFTNILVNGRETARLQGTGSEAAKPVSHLVELYDPVFVNSVVNDVSAIFVLPAAAR
jgi:hypothetical protein